MAFINHYIYSFIFVICFFLLLLFYVILFVLNNKLYLSIYLIPTFIHNTSQINAAILNVSSIRNKVDHTLDLLMTFTLILFVSQKRGLKIRILQYMHPLILII